MKLHRISHTYMGRTCPQELGRSIIPSTLWGRFNVSMSTAAISRGNRGYCSETQPLGSSQGKKNDGENTKHVEKEKSVREKFCLRTLDILSGRMLMKRLSDRIVSKYTDRQQTKLSKKKFPKAVKAVKKKLNASKLTGEDFNSSFREFLKNLSVPYAYQQNAADMLDMEYERGRAAAVGRYSVYIPIWLLFTLLGLFITYLIRRALEVEKEELRNLSLLTGDLSDYTKKYLKVHGKIHLAFEKLIGEKYDSDTLCQVDLNQIELQYSQISANLDRLISYGVMHKLIDRSDLEHVNSLCPSYCNLNELSSLRTIRSTSPPSNPSVSLFSGSNAAKLQFHMQCESLCQLRAKLRTLDFFAKLLLQRYNQNFGDALDQLEELIGKFEIPPMLDYDLDRIISGKSNNETLFDQILKIELPLELTAKAFLLKSVIFLDIADIIAKGDYMKNKVITGERMKRIFSTYGIRNIANADSTELQKVCYKEAKKAALVSALGGRQSALVNLKLACLKLGDKDAKKVESEIKRRFPSHGNLCSRQQD